MSSCKHPALNRRNDFAHTLTQKYSFVFVFFCLCWTAEKRKFVLKSFLVQSRRGKAFVSVMAVQCNITFVWTLLSMSRKFYRSKTKLLRWTLMLSGIYLLCNACERMICRQKVLALILKLKTTCFLNVFGQVYSFFSHLNLKLQPSVYLLFSKWIKVKFMFIYANKLQHITYGMHSY